MPFLRRLSLSMLFACFFIHGITVRLNAQEQSTETVGTPWTGAPGLARSTGEIMAKDRELTTLGVVRPLRLSLEHEVDRENLPRNPFSPDVSQFPPGPADVKSSQEKSVFAPQPLSTSFTGATFADALAFPPDAMGAIGPTQYIVDINGRIRTFNKTTGTADGVL